MVIQKEMETSCTPRVINYDEDEEGNDIHIYIREKTKKYQVRPP
jgi:hypothetical protein